MAKASCNLQAWLCFETQSCCNLANPELEAKGFRHVVTCPVTESFIPPSTPACGTLHTLPDERFGIDGEIVDFGEDSPPFPQMWIDRSLSVFQVTPVRVIDGGVTSGAQIVPDAPFKNVGMKEHWLEGFVVQRTSLEHCYSLQGTVDESGLNPVRDLVKGLAKSLQSNRKCIFISPTCLTLRKQCPVVLRPIVVIIGS